MGWLDDLLKDDFGQRVLDAQQFHAERRRQNVEAVVQCAADTLADKWVPDAEPDHDWVGRFFRDVQDVSDPELQALYGKVLAREIERPGSFSLLCLSVLHNLDTGTTALFQTLCSLGVVILGSDDEILDARVPVPQGSAGSNALAPYGLSFDRLNILNEHGLVISDYNTWGDYQGCVVRPDENGAPGVVHAFRFQGRSWVLDPIDGTVPDGPLTLAGVRFTHTGAKLSRIVEGGPAPEFAEHLKASFRYVNLRMAPADSLKSPEPAGTRSPAGIDTG